MKNGNILSRHSMIVFPVLNFVLPLILTSLLLVNSQGCIECKNNKDIKTSGSTVIGINNENKRSTIEVESTDEKLLEKKYKGNIR